MRIHKHGGIVKGISLTIEEATVLHDCLQDLLDLPVLNLNRVTELGVTWPRERSRELEIELRDLLLGSHHR
jgi:uncharacterized protein (DUF2384 family)